MSELTIDTIGYVALAINLYSMSLKGEYGLRVLSLGANILYIVYGSLIAAAPIVIGCATAVLLHAYHIRRLRLSTDND